jgi:hypothetical protein
MTDQVLAETTPPVVYGPYSRVKPLPSAPFDNEPWAGYRAAKQLALDATERFVEEKKPHFTVVNLMPGYVLGRHELATKAEDLLNISNGYVLGIVLGFFNGVKRESVTTPITDLARIHVEALEEKVEGNQSFLVIHGDHSPDFDFNRVNEIAKTEFADAVADGILNPVGSTDASYQQIDASATTKLFGTLDTFENAARATIAQYVELKRQEAIA